MTNSPAPAKSESNFIVSRLRWKIPCLPALSIALTFVWTDETDQFGLRREKIGGYWDHDREERAVVSAG